MLSFTNKITLIFSNVKLKYKLIASYILIVSIPIILIGYVSYNNFKKSMDEELSSVTFNYLKQISNNIEANLRTMEGMTTALNIAVNNDEEFINNFWDNPTSMSEELKFNNVFGRVFSSFIYLRTDLQSLFIYKESDKSIYCKGKYSYSIKTAEDLAKSDWFKKVRNSKGEIIIFGTHIPYEYVVPSDSKDMVFSLCRQINDFTSNRKLGMVMIDYNLDVIDNICKNDNTKSQTIIIDENGEIVYHPIHSKIMKFIDPQILNTVNQREEGFTKLSINNESYQVTYVTLMFAKWKIINIVPVKVLMARASATTNIILIILAVGIILCIFIGTLFYYDIITPIYKLIKSMQIVEKKNFESDIEIIRKDEIGALANNFNQMVKRIRNMILTVYEANLKKRDAQIMALNFQMNPHFIFNTLQVIYSIASLRKDEEIKTIASCMSEMLKYSLRESRDTVPLFKEIEHIKNYLTILKIRDFELLDFDISIPPEHYQYEVPKFILQPLVENSVSHGIEKSIQKCLIRITSFYQNGSIVIEVYDNGVGISEEKINEIYTSLSKSVYELSLGSLNTKNIGLANIHSRIAVLYGEGYGVSIESIKGDYTRIRLTLPARTYEEGRNIVDKGIGC